MCGLSYLETHGVDLVGEALDSVWKLGGVGERCLGGRVASRSLPTYSQFIKTNDALNQIGRRTVVHEDIWATVFRTQTQNMTLWPLTLVAKAGEVLSYHGSGGAEDEVFADAAPKVVVRVPAHLGCARETIVVRPGCEGEEREKRQQETHGVMGARQSTLGCTSGRANELAGAVDHVMKRV